MIKHSRETILALRKECDESGLSVSAFAKGKGMSYWKVQYALRQSRKYKTEKEENKLGFKKIVSKTEDVCHNDIANKEMRIMTSYGAQIIIPL